MSVATEISRLQTAKAGIKSALEAKGVTVDSATTLDGYPQLVESIPSGGDEELVKALIQGGLTGLTVPNGTTSIKNSFAINDSSLTYIDLGNTVTTIGSSSFHNCGNLTSVTRASAVTNVYGNGFRDCKKLPEISGMGVLTVVESSSFENCEQLTNGITISADTVGYAAFKNCKTIPSFTFLKNTTFESYSDSDSYAHFQNDSACTYWDFSDTYVISLLKNNRAFNGCTGEIRVPASMYDGWMATVLPHNTGQVNKFYQCSLSGNVVSVADKYSSTTVHYTTTNDAILSPSQTNGSEYHKLGFGIVKNVYDATTGGTMVLYGPSAVTNPNIYFITLSRNTLKTFEATGITALGPSGNTFSGCTAMTDVNIPNVAVLTNMCFYNNKSLSSVTFGNVTVIPDYAFENCTSLTSFDFSNVTQLGRDAFMASGLITVDLSNVHTMIDTGTNGNQFRNCQSLTSAIVNCDIAGYCFSGCNNLTSITCDTGVTLIMGSAFENYTQNLLEITFLSETPPSLTGGSQFYWRSGLTQGVIYCPATAIDAYTTWKSTISGIGGWPVQAIS